MRNRAVRLICALAFALVASLVPAAAQAPPAAPAPAAAPSEPGSVATQRLDSARAGLDQIRQTLARPDVSDATLQGLRSGIDPLAQAIQTIITDLTPRLDDVQKRLAQLGPKPDDKAPPEDASITAERDSQQKLSDTIDGILNRPASSPSRPTRPIRSSSIAAARCSRAPCSPRRRACSPRRCGPM